MLASDQTLSRNCRIAAAFVGMAIALIPIIVTGLWLFAGPDLLRSQEAQHYLIPAGVLFSSDVATLSWTTRFSALAVTLLPNALLMAALWQLLKLLTGFTTGDCFSRTSTRRFRLLAGFVFAYALSLPLAGAALSVVTSWINGPGQRLLSISLSDSNIGLLLVGACLLVLAQVWDRARSLADENASFI